MRAAVVYQHGPIDNIVLENDYRDPELAPDWVRVRVRACSVNYHDIFSRRGMPGIRIELPSITGGDCAGEVDATGPGVADWKPGQRVLADPAFVDRAAGRIRMLGENCRGAFAELCVVHHSQLIALPDNVGDEDAACLPVAYGTSHRMLFTRGELREGESILILGASGGVGTSCLLLAKLRGAHVVAAAGSAEKCARLRALGADETIDYSTTDIAAYVREKTGGMLRGGGYDVVVNFTGGDTFAPSLRCLKMGGRLLTCGATAGFEATTDLRYVWTGELDVRGSNGWRHDDLLALIELVRTGALRPVIDRVLPLSSGIEACRLLEERRFFGKIVVRP